LILIGLVPPAFTPPPAGPLEIGKTAPALACGPGGFNMDIGMTKPFGIHVTSAQVDARHMVLPVGIRF